VREVLATPTMGVNLSYRLAFLNLTGDKEGALAGYRESLARRGSPNFAWEAALLAEELKQPKVRNESLAIVIRTGNTIDFQRPYLIELAQLAQQALANKDRMATLPVHIDALLKKIDDPRERATVASLGGRFLVLQGEDKGLPILEQAASLPFTHSAAALAAGALASRRNAAEGKRG
jgi:hypothetical protein